MLYLFGFDYKPMSDVQQNFDSNVEINSQSDFDDYECIENEYQSIANFVVQLYERDFNKTDIIIAPEYSGRDKNF